MRYGLSALDGRHGLHPEFNQGKGFAENTRLIADVDQGQLQSAGNALHGADADVAVPVITDFFPSDQPEIA